MIQEHFREQTEILAVNLQAKTCQTAAENVHETVAHLVKPPINFKNRYTPISINLIARWVAKCTLHSMPCSAKRALDILEAKLAHVQLPFWYTRVFLRKWRIIPGIDLVRADANRTNTQRRGTISEGRWRGRDGSLEEGRGGWRCFCQVVLVYWLVKLGELGTQRSEEGMCNLWWGSRERRLNRCCREGLGGICVDTHRGPWWRDEWYTKPTFGRHPTGFEAGLVFWLDRSFGRIRLPWL